ncbi:hypothetical protein [Nonomuraea sp. bgisy101]|uniref:hypothetical protein n=1 Tax=Nonomuraea sp. bgisy101 TaxID=3413784 RepID=UPI003D744A9D
MTTTTARRIPSQSVTSAAEDLGVSASTVRRWITDGSLQARAGVVAVRTGSTWTIVCPEDVAELQAAARPVALSTEARIRAAYTSLQARSGWVSLTDLRPMLADVPRAEMDATLRQMLRQGDVVIVPEDNQKALRPEDRAAALVLGDQPKHYIAIGLR